MKSKSFLNPLLWTMAFILSSANLTAQIRGNGIVTEQKRNVPPFTGIVVKSGIDLFVSQTGHAGVTIKADGNLQKYIITEVKDDILYVYVEKNRNIWRSTAMNASITVGDLRLVRVSGGGDVAGKDIINSHQLKLVVSGGGDLDMLLNSVKTQLAVSGGGDAELDGKISELNASVTGGGDIELKADMNNLSLSVSGGGDVEINSDKEMAFANIAVSGGGDIEINTPCKEFKLNVSGGGDAVIRTGNHLETAKLSATGGGDLYLYLKAGMLNLYVNGG